jgi:DHA1 family bicyclomycin/chloramphenicol resistance-like MFS transporter
MSQMSFQTKNLYIAQIILMAIITEMGSTDIILPSLPNIQKFYVVSTDIVTLLISFNLFGAALSGILYGWFSDNIGRRKIYLLGLSIFFLGSFLCSLSTSIFILIIARCIQGTGGGVCATVGLAIIKDIFNEKSYVKTISWMGFFLSASPAIFSIIGSYFTLKFGWTFNFHFISVLAFIVLLLVYKFLPESLLNTNTTKISVSEFFLKYFQLFKNLRFLAYSFICVLSYAVLWLHLTIFSFLFDKIFLHEKITFGMFIFINVIVGALGTVIHTKCVDKLDIQLLLIIGIIIALVSSILFIIIYIIQFNSIECITLTTSLYWIAIAFIFPNASALALNEFPNDQGSVASLIISLELLFSSFLVYVGSYFYDGTIAIIANVTFCLILIICILKLKAKNISI